ncbi:MAG: hypothetical protein ACYC96_12475 [Fimbriimonadaceae bacterium]
MRLEVLRATALCWFGNEHLFCADESRLAEVNLKSCFRGVERLEFLRPLAHQFAAPGAAFVLGSKTWYRRLKADGVESLRLHLPISLHEPVPSAYGIVGDTPVGCDIWVQTPRSTSRSVEYAAQRFAVWSLPRLIPSQTVSTQLVAAIAALDAEFGGPETLIARRVSYLAALCREAGQKAEGFEDCIPAEFAPNWHSLAVTAVNTIAILGAEDLDLVAHPAIQEPVDQVWKLALKLVESIAADVASERAQAAAA